MIDPAVISTAGVPSVTACNPHPRRGAPYPREVWVDRPVWGLGVRQASDPSSELGHRVGVGFLEGPELLPFYSNRNQEATFTVLHGILVDGFYRFTAGSRLTSFRHRK